MGALGSDSSLESQILTSTTFSVVFLMLPITTSELQVSGQQTAGVQCPLLHTSRYMLSSCLAADDTDPTHLAEVVVGAGLLHSESPQPFCPVLLRRKSFCTAHDQG